MGWDIRNEGLFVVFAKSIPTIVSTWFKPVLENFIERFHLTVRDLNHFIAHPAGKKVIEAYIAALNVDARLFLDAAEILKSYGNMSSPTVLFVLDRIMKKAKEAGEKGIAISIGPGFSAELLLLEWEAGA